MSNKLANHYKRIVIKVGSALLTDIENARLRTAWLHSLCKDIARLREEGCEVVLVSSGAVALGRAVLLQNAPAVNLEVKQACAAVGQTNLMQAYREMFMPFSIVPGQLLVTYADFENRRSYLNVRATVQSLLDHNAIPILNENDSIATQELRFGDNDRMAAIIAQMIDADALLLLSDIDGLYTGNPELDKKATHVPFVDKVTEEIEAYASGAVSSIGSGGMRTKVSAARLCLQSGVDVWLTNGRHNDPITYLENNKGKYTLFKADPLQKETARKRWILSNIHNRGVIVIDAGAVRAIREGNSLLPSGIIDAHGEFERGDTVQMVDSYENEIAKGLSAYNMQDVLSLRGHNSHDAALITGYKGRSEVIHRDNLVLS